MSNNNNTIIPDDLITTINDFKKSKNGSMINIHGKEYATVAHRVAVLRRNLGAKAKIETEVISIDTVLHGDFFKNGVNSPILFTDQEDGYLNVYLFLQPTIGTSDASGTMSMATLIFTVQDEGLAPIRYTSRTTIRDKSNYSLQLNQYGEALINAVY